MGRIPGGTARRRQESQQRSTRSKAAAASASRPSAPVDASSTTWRSSLNRRTSRRPRRGSSSTTRRCISPDTGVSGRTLKAAERPIPGCHLTKSPIRAMIPRSVETNRRSSPTRSRRRPGLRNLGSDPRNVLDRGAGRTGRVAAPSAELRPRDMRPEGSQGTIESANHDNLGCGPLRRDASSSTPRRQRRPTLLQHERLHQLSHRRHRNRHRQVRDLRLYPPAPLS
jgi:hypothetical protein